MRPSATICLLLISTTLLVFSQTVVFDFVTLDDTQYVVDNAHVHAGLTLDGLRWAITTGQESIWHPLTSISFLLDSQLFGLDPAGYHATNVLLHIVNSLLLFAVLQFMTAARWRSALVAALFALHPLHVEPIAWVSQRKDVLSTCFALLTIWAYAAYAKRSSARRYLLTLLFLVLGLAAKPMLVTLPFVLLLLDYWPLHRRHAAPRQLNILLLDKIPMLALSATVCVITFAKQQASGAMGPGQSVPLMLRLANAAVSYVRYLGKMFVPTNLSVMYPHPNLPGGTAWTAWQITVAFAILLLITAAVLVAASRRYALVGWLWYLGTLVPVIGLVQVGRQAMADRYSYLPLIGPFILIVWTATDLINRWPRRVALRVRLAATVSTLVLVTCASAAFIQTRHWRNSISLYTQSLRATAASPTLHNNLGMVYQLNSNFTDAEHHFRQVLDINPQHNNARYNLANLLQQQGKPDEATSHYRQILKHLPSHIPARTNLGVSLYTLGRFDEAIEQLSHGLRLDEDNATAHYSLANVFNSGGRTDQAIYHYHRALQIKPDFVNAMINLSAALGIKERYEEALEQLQLALQIAPHSPLLHYSLGIAMTKTGQPQLAVNHWHTALDLAVQNGNIHLAKRVRQQLDAMNQPR